jgi:hypothetical protein
MESGEILASLDLSFQNEKHFFSNLNWNFLSQKKCFYLIYATNKRRNPRIFATPPNPVHVFHNYNIQLITSNI